MPRKLPRANSGTSIRKYSDCGQPLQKQGKCARIHKIIVASFAIQAHKEMENYSIHANQMATLFGNCKRLCH